VVFWKHILGVISPGHRNKQLWHQLLIVVNDMVRFLVACNYMKESVLLKLSLINTHDFVVYELLNAVSGYRGDSRFDGKDTMVSLYSALELGLCHHFNCFFFLGILYQTKSIISNSPPTMHWVGLGFRRG